jgi:hypothetical protein
MTVNNDDLMFETHLARYEWGLTGRVDQDQFWRHQAQEIHMLCAIDGVSDIQVQVVILAQHLPAGPAHHQLLFGVARRSKMIMGAMRQLHAMVKPDRREPLPHDNIFEVERALNDIYIHSRGLLDNYAWAVFHLFGDDQLRQIHQNDVSLFRRRFQQHPSVADFGEVGAQFSTWEQELKERRDPVAHRIPLTVPPAILNEKDAEIYGQLQEEANNAAGHLTRLVSEQAPIDEIETASEALKRVHDRMGLVGTFFPLIVHDPEKGGVPIYPTVAQDVGTLVRMARSLNERIRERLCQ